MMTYMSYVQRMQNHVYVYAQVEAIVTQIFKLNPSLSSYRLPAAAPPPPAPPSAPPASTLPNTPPLCAAPAPPALTYTHSPCRCQQQQVQRSPAGNDCPWRMRGVQRRQLAAAPDARALQQGRGDACGHQFPLSVTIPEAQGNVILLLILLILLIIIVLLKCSFTPGVEAAMFGHCC